MRDDTTLLPETELLLAVVLDNLSATITEMRQHRTPRRPAKVSKTAPTTGRRFQKWTSTRTIEEKRCAQAVARCKRKGWTSIVLKCGSDWLLASGPTLYAAIQDEVRLLREYPAAAREWREKRGTR